MYSPVRVDDREPRKSLEQKASPAPSNHSIKSSNVLDPQPTVTICVQSPTDPPHGDFTPPPFLENNTILDDDDDELIDEPIDVTIERDTTNIFYDYHEITDDEQPITSHAPRDSQQRQEQPQNTRGPRNDDFIQFDSYVELCREQPDDREKSS